MGEMPSLFKVYTRTYIKGLGLALVYLILFNTLFSFSLRIITIISAPTVWPHFRAQGT